MSSRKKVKAHIKSPVPAGRGSSWPWVAAVLMIIGLAAVGVFLFSNRRSGTTALPSASVNRVAEARTVMGQYAGSASCRECHQEIFSEWEGSHHALAERVPNDSLDRDAFVPGRVLHRGQEHTQVGATNNVYAINTLGPSNRYDSFQVERIIGHDPLRQFLVRFPGGRYQTLEASYDPSRNEWFNSFGNETRQPGEWGHWTGRGMNWNNMCAECHNTRLRKNYNTESDSYQTTMPEMGVGCEACHGPLKTHNQWQTQYGKSGRPDPTLLKLSRNQTMENCGFCHARRSELISDFKPGNNFFDHARLAMVDETDTFYADGQVRDEDYEFSAFLGSRMHARGVVCKDCHNPHTAKVLLPGNWLCMRCHNGSVTNAPLIEPVSHSHHQVFGYDTNGLLASNDLMHYKPKEIRQTGGECVNCHMPQTVYMQRHWRHDHGFTIPDPLLSKQGIPNACNRCHQDRDTNWSAGWVEKWYGEKMIRPTRARALVIASARAGDPSGRDGLLKLLPNEEIPYWRAVACGLLGRWITETPVREALVKGLKDLSPLVRETCVRSLEPLAESDPSHVGTEIGHCLEDQARSVRLAAAWALRAHVDATSNAGKEMLEWLDFNADQPAGQMQLGVYALARRDSQQALAHYERAIAWDPNSAPIHHDLAVVLSGLGRSAEAVAHLETACRLEPRNAEYRYRLALGWNEIGNAKKTIESLQLAVQLDAAHSLAWYNLGLAFDAAARTQEGLEALARAEAISPNDPRTPYAIATILARNHQLREARRAVERALRVQPGFEPAQTLMNALREGGDP